MAKKASVPLDAVDKEILSALYNERDIALSYRMWCLHYFAWEPLPAQETMVTAGFNPAAIPPHPREIEYENLYTIKNLDVLAAIRSGKTLGMGMGMLYLAWCFPGLDLANMGPSVDQAATMFRILLPFLAAKPFERFVQRPEGGNAIQRHPYPTIFLWNGSTLEFRGAGKDYVEQIRSREYDKINVDEAALFGAYAISVLEGRVLGAKGGRKRLGLFSLTTSKRMAAAWLRARAERGDPDNPRRRPDCLLIEMRTAENVHLDSKRVQAVAEGMSVRLREQELENKWVAQSEKRFPTDVLMEAFSQLTDSTGIVKGLEEALVKLLGDRAFETEWQDFMLPAEKGHYYVCGMDIGKGRRARQNANEDLGQRGATVACVLDVTAHPYKLVGFRYSERTGHWQRAISLAKEIRDHYPTIEMGWDSTGPGDVIDEVANDSGLGVEFPVKFLGNIIKANMVRGLAWTLEHGLIKGPLVKILFNQLDHYVDDDDDIPQDAVSALMIAAHVAREREEGGDSGAVQVKQDGDWRVPSSREYARSQLFTRRRE